MVSIQNSKIDLQTNLYLSNVMFFGKIRVRTGIGGTNLKREKYCCISFLSRYSKFIDLLEDHGHWLCPLNPYFPYFCIFLLSAADIRCCCYLGVRRFNWNRKNQWTLKRFSGQSIRGPPDGSRGIPEYYIPWIPQGLFYASLEVRCFGSNIFEINNVRIWISGHNLLVKQLLRFLVFRQMVEQERHWWSYLVTNREQARILKPDSVKAKNLHF